MIGFLNTLATTAGKLGTAYITLENNQNSREFAIAQASQERQAAAQSNSRMMVMVFGIVAVMVFMKARK